MEPNKYDVAILGAGIAGTVLGAILARKGVKVIILERGEHPRFAIGESLTPESSTLCHVLAKRYDVPELENLSNFQKIRRNIATTSGVKRNFSFVYHNENEKPNPLEATQYPTWAPPIGPDAHVFRQDTDSYLVSVAIKHGAVVKQKVSVEDIDIEENAVFLKTAKGETIQAEFLVDGGGYRSPVSEKFDLKEKPTRLKTTSRSIFTHMINVKPFDACIPRKDFKVPSPFAQGTLHHVFKGGWMWVIPFDNHPTSTNNLCSVGINLDTEFYPETGMEPEEEFWSITNRFPGIAEQLRDASSVRNWVGTGRLQFSTNRMVGDRYCLLPHSAGIIDALYSTGLTLTLSGINSLAHRLIKAVETKQFKRDDFLYSQEWFNNSLEYYDRLVNCSYKSFSNFELWNAWHRVWMIGLLYGVCGQYEILGKFSKTKDLEVFNLFEQKPYRGSQAIDWDPYMKMFKDSAEEVEAAHRGDRSYAEATEAIYRIIEESKTSPGPWLMEKPKMLYPARTLTILPMIRLVFWGRFSSPDFVRRSYFRSGSVASLIAATVSNVLVDGRRAGRTNGGLLRDHFVSWTKEWRRKAA